jgi:TPR repeat protein
MMKAACQHFAWSASKTASKFNGHDPEEQTSSEARGTFRRGACRLRDPFRRRCPLGGRRRIDNGYRQEDHRRLFPGTRDGKKDGRSDQRAPGAGQHLRISKLECDTRQGESILYDAADPRTALQLWSGPAKDGDPEAQNRLGQIYELGIGTEPDYNEAAKLYRRAADAAVEPPL